MGITWVSLKPIGCLWAECFSVGRIITYHQVFVIKEGVQYRIRIDFIVQREIVHGLKYVQKTYRLGVPVDKMTHMVGSYPPKTEIQSYTTPPEDAPSGMVARGSYSVNSLFTDDDKNVHLQWEWCFDIKKDWKD
uniref:SFRICE_022130 n=1 Tax=Spodoptera frugiperda TaxID=7108 RepID=A0A2H1WBL7_SPOFR